MARTKQTTRHPGGYAPRKRPRQMTAEEKELAEAKIAEGPLPDSDEDKPVPGPYPCKVGAHGWCLLYILEEDRLSWSPMRDEEGLSKRCVAVSNDAPNIRCKVEQTCYKTDGEELISEWEESKTGLCSEWAQNGPTRFLCSHWFCCTRC